MPTKASAIAHSNIALAKYWGKRDIKLNIPAVSSISLTLDALSTKTQVELSENFKQDIFILNGIKVTGLQLDRLSQFLDIIRALASVTLRAKVISDNNFPTSAGLASSASGFAALTIAVAKALSLELSPTELSILARRGSGSAARSVFGGIVQMNSGSLRDGSDAFAEQLYDENFWDLRLLVLITSEQEKTIGSTQGMQLTANTSPFYESWVSSSDKNLDSMAQAIKSQDFERLGELTEHSCLKMHGLALSANPGLLYWNATTVKLIHEIRNLRQNSIPAYFTIDAGPQVKVLCLPEQVAQLTAHFETFPGVQRIISTGLGPGAHPIETHA